MSQSLWAVQIGFRLHVLCLFEWFLDISRFKNVHRVPYKDNILLTVVKLSVVLCLKKKPYQKNQAGTVELHLSKTE